MDLINYVPSADVEGLKKTAGAEIFQVPSVYNFMIYPEVSRDQSPTVTDVDASRSTRTP